jgi:hypothetical protein
MNELGDSLERMSFMQLLLLFAFVTSYVLALGGLLGKPARLRAALLALLLAAAFSALTDPWVHGALLTAFVVAGLGLFVVFSWLLAWMLGPRQAPPPLVVETGASVPASMFRAEDAAAAPELPRRARASRS